MKTIKTLIKEAIKREESYISEHNEILELLTPLDGKDINKRTLNSKRLGEKFKFRFQYGMFHIDGKYSHLIGYRENPTINIEQFKKYDACHGSAAEGRINKLKNIDVAKLEKISRKIDKHFNAIRETFGEIESNKLDSFNNPIYYDMLRNIYKDEDNNSYSKIKLSDFHFIKK